jgi:putative oxidoreductase
MIGNGLGRYRDTGLLLLRIGLGAAFIAHGWPKLMGGTAMWRQIGSAVPLPAPVVWGCIAALVEVVGGLFFAVGFLFRVASFLLFVQMAVAVSFHMRMKDPVMSSFTMGWSHAFETGIVFLGMTFVGPGRYSIDAGLCPEVDRSRGFDAVTKAGP